MSRFFPSALLVQGGLALGLFILAVLLPPPHFFSSPRDVLPLHITLKFLSIMVAMKIFVVGWFSLGYPREARFPILACAFLAVALLDFAHILSYAGIPDPIRPGLLEKTINFWWLARMITALTLLIVAVLPPQTALNQQRCTLLLTMTLIMVAGLITLGLFFPDNAPQNLLPGHGLTLFEISAEYAVLAGYGVALVLLIRDWRRERDSFRALLIAGTWILLIGGLSLTFYAAVTDDLHNLINDLYKAWGGGFLFWAVYTQAMDQPYRLLAQNEARTQALLRENQLLLDSAFVGMFFVKYRYFIRVNRQAETLFGYAHGELDNVSAEVIYPDHAAFLALGERAYPVINRGEMFVGEMELVRKDGSRFWCLMRGQALTPGQPADGSIWIMEDVTERRRAQQALQDAADLYRAIFESRDVVKVLIDPENGRIVDANQAAAEFYGEPRDNLRQHYVWELSATPRERLMARFADFKSGRANLTDEHQAQHRRANGELCEVGVHLDLIQRENRRFLLATVLDLTARKAAEAAIQANLAFQQELLEAMPTPVFYKDIAGRYQNLNGAFSRFFGYAPAELIGKTVHECWPLEAADRFAAKDQALLANPGVQIYEAQLPNAQGELRTVVFHKATLHDPDGSPHGLIGIVMDITERKAAEAALQHSELRFRTLFSAAKVTMLLIDPDAGAIVDANAAAGDYYGYPVEQLRGMKVSAINILSPDQIAEEMRQAKQENRSHFHFRHRLAGGDVRDVEVHSGPLELDGRSLLYSIIHDITDRRRLQEERRKLSQAVEQSPVSIVITDLEGNIEYVNHQFLQVTGYTPDEVLGENPRVLKSGETPSEEYEALWQTISRGQTWSGVLHNRKKNGDLYWERANISPICDEQSRITHYLGIKENITAQKAAEDALCDSEERYRTALVALTEGVAVYNLQGALITANPAANRILGLSATEYQQRLVDAGTWRIIHPDGSPFPNDEWPSVITLRTGVPQREVLMGVFRPDGCLSWILVGTEPICDVVTGVLQAVVVSFSDITARKETEDALRDSEQRLQQVLEGANDGFWDWNVVTGEVLFSPRWAQMLGYDLIEIEPQISSWENLVHPDDLLLCRTTLHAHFAGEIERYQCEHRMLAKNGEWHWILDRGKVTARDDQGRPLRMAGTHTDITERRHMEETLRASLAEVKRHDARMIGLNRMNDLLLSCETREEAYQIIARSAGRLFAWCNGGLAMRVGDAYPPQFQVVATWGAADTLPATFLLNHCWALRRGELHQVPGSAHSAQCRHFSGSPPSSYLCIPLIVRGETFGLLHVSAGIAQTEEQFQELRTLAIAISEATKLALSNLKLREALREQAIRDPLTGLFNRRYLDETLVRELHRCQRLNEPLTAAMIDVDHFKRFNDSYGHEAGDAVLRAIGDLLNRSLRAGDIACRYGGEELTVILPGSTLADAKVKLDILRRIIMAMQVPYQGENLPTITVSIGVAAAEDQKTDAVALLGRADAALYLAKERGRNRVLTEED